MKRGKPSNCGLAPVDFARLSTLTESLFAASESKILRSIAVLTAASCKGFDGCLSKLYSR